METVQTMPDVFERHFVEAVNALTDFNRANKKQKRFDINSQAQYEMILVRQTPRNCLTLTLGIKWLEDLQWDHYEPMMEG